MTCTVWQWDVRLCSTFYVIQEEMFLGVISRWNVARSESVRHSIRGPDKVRLG